MANTYTQLYTQSVYSVQGRTKLIKENFRDELEKVMCGIVSNQICKTYAIYCNPDHTHLFAGMHSSISLSKLMEQVIRTFVEKNPAISYAELQAIFPQRLQGSMGVFDTIENAQEIHNRTGHKRHSLNSDELIKLSDSIMATSNQWGIGNINKFVKHVNEMGDGIQVEGM